MYLDASECTEMHPTGGGQPLEIAEETAIIPGGSETRESGSMHLSHFPCPVTAGQWHCRPVDSSPTASCEPVVQGPRGYGGAPGELV